MSQETKICQNCKSQFTVEPDDFGFYEKMDVPAPNLCPECRFKRRAASRNEFTLYNRACDRCAQPIVSMYHPNARYVVYCPECWHSDAWDPFSFGRAYDPARPFFEQLEELVLHVPKISIYRSDVMPSVNSPYENFAGGNRDCYLIANSGPGNENCAYSRGLIKSREAFDAYIGDSIERVYEGIGIHHSSGIAWGQNVLDSLDSWFVLNGAGLQNCFGCVNLRHRAYHFLNEPLSKEEYKKRTDAIRGSYRRMEEFRASFEDFSLKFPRRATNNLKSVDVSGDYIFESKNCHASFEISFCENASYLFSVKLAKDVYDIIGHGRGAELLLECVAAGYSSRLIGCWWVENGERVEYSVAVRTSSDCFGCDGIKNATYAILNKRYAEAEYREIRARIVDELARNGEYGLYFPPSLALFAYNETIAQDNFPLTKKQALAQGFRWQDELQMTKGKETMKSAQIPDHIRDVPDSLVKEILACVSCGRNYRIIEPELQFYRKMVLPVPRTCFFCRHADRIRRRGPFKLFDRTCAKCAKAIKTNFAPERPEIVYCEQCYQAEVA